MSKPEKKSLQLRLQSLFTLALIVVSIIANSDLRAQSNEKPNNSQTQDIQISFEPPNRGTPESTEGTGSRGDCLDKPDLPPLRSIGGKNNLKLTTRERPTFWVYLPYSQSEVSHGEFSLQEKDREVYRTRVKLPAKPGIVGISLPDQALALNEGKQYHWYLDINCSASASSDSLATPASLTGIVQRVTLSEDVTRELETPSPSLNQVATYAKNGIWYDAVTELAQLRLQEPENSEFKQAWDKLLCDQYVNLSEISAEPIRGILPSW